MRSDPRRNRERLLAAATRLILEVGSEPSRDAIAQRAGVGIATLYRNFPERQDLLRAVVVDVLDRAIAAAESTLTDAGTDVDTDVTALGRYLHAAIDVGLGVVNIIHPLLADTDWPERAAVAGELLDRLIDEARQTGSIGRDTTTADIVFASIRLARPLAIGLDRAAELDIAHRQLDHYLAGLRAAAENDSLPDGKVVR